MKIGKINVDNIQKILTKNELRANTPDISEEKQIPELQEAVKLPEDKVDISKEAKNNEDDFQSKLDEMRNRYQMLLKGIEDAKNVGEGMAKAFKEKLICLRIAMRIMSGDNVPIEDKRFLAEKDLELYCQAISLRRVKPNPKDHDRLSEDEENNINNDTTDNEPDNSVDTEAEVTEETSATAEAGIPQDADVS
jgi:hypothetical protein